MINSEELIDNLESKEIEAQNESNLNSQQVRDVRIDIDRLITEYLDKQIQVKILSEKLDTLKAEIKLICNDEEYSSDVGKLIINNTSRTAINKALAENVLGDRISEIMKKTEYTTYQIKK